MAERTLAARAPVEFDNLGGRARLLGLGLLLGVVAGMGTFMHIKNQLLPGFADRTWSVALMALAGAYSHFLARDLNDSISISLLGFLSGLGVHVLAWISPLWILAYPPLARDVILPKMIGQAITGAILVYLVTFWSAYFAAVLFAGYLKP